MKEPRSCGFLIVKGDPVESFLLMEHADRWDLPKGHVDPGESDLECALRELEEETGITAADIEIDEGFEYETSYQVQGKRYGVKDGKVDKTLRIFLGRIVRDVEIVVTEHQGCQWFPWEPPHSIQTRAIDPVLDAVEQYLTSSKTTD